MPQNPNFQVISTATAPYVYAGTDIQQIGGMFQPSGYVYRQRSAVAAIYTATVGGAFDGSRDLGVSVNGGVFQFDNAATLAAWITGMQAKFTTFGLPLTITNPVGTTVQIVGPSDGTQYTLAPVQPSSPDLTLSAFSLTADTGVASPTVRPGMAVFHKDFRWEVEAAKPASVLTEFAGVVLRESLLSDDEVIGLTGELEFPRKLVDENPARCKDRGEMTVLVATGVTVAVKDPVYIGRKPTEAGLFYNADDGGNTRLLLTGAMFAMAGTGDETAEKGFKVNIR